MQGDKNDYIWDQKENSYRMWKINYNHIICQTATSLENVDILLNLVCRNNFFMSGEYVNFSFQMSSSRLKIIYLQKNHISIMFKKIGKVLT